MKTMCGGNVIDYNLQGTPSFRLGFGNRTRDDLIVFMAYTFPGLALWEPVWEPLGTNFQNSLVDLLAVLQYGCIYTLYVITPLLRNCNLWVALCIHQHQAHERDFAVSFEEAIRFGKISGSFCLSLDLGNVGTFHQENICSKPISFNM